MLQILRLQPLPDFLLQIRQGGNAIGSQRRRLILLLRQQRPAQITYRQRLRMIICRRRFQQISRQRQINKPGAGICPAIAQKHG